MKRVVTSLLLAVGLFSTQSAQMLPLGALPTKVASCADANWANVSLLAANENGANNSTSFTDQSGNALALTAVGDAKWTTTSPPTGLTSSATFDGTGDWLSIADSTVLDLGTSNAAYTIEMYFNPTSTGGFKYIGRGGGAGSWSTTNGHQYIIFYDGGGTTYMQYNTGGSWNTLSGTTTLSAGTWYHIALTSDGTTVRGYLGGVQFGSVGASAIYKPSSTTITKIGTSAPNENPINGKIASVRITKGVARYTGAGSFTPPTLPLPNC